MTSSTLWNISATNDHLHIANKIKALSTRLINCEFFLIFLYFSFYMFDSFGFPSFPIALELFAAFLSLIRSNSFWFKTILSHKHREIFEHWKQSKIITITLLTKLNIVIIKNFIWQFFIIYYLLILIKNW